jgi:ABC-type nitrate/sulfonate/bicarbonate transport system substrate-binding protein
VSTHPAEAQQIVAAELNLPLPVVQKAWQRQNWTSTIDNALREDIQQKADFLKTVGFVRNRVDAKSLLQPASN